MKVYISGPVRGHADAIDRFIEAEMKLKADNTPFNPERILRNYPTEQMSERQIMNVCYTMLDQCEGIYMLNGWEDSLGAREEHGYALAKDLIIMYEP